MAKFLYELDSEGRIAAADAVIEETRQLIRGWIADRSAQNLPANRAFAFARFGRHFRVIEDVLLLMLGAIQEDLHSLPGHAGTEVAYERSRRADRRVGKVRETFRWYARKYEQRESGPDGYGPVLRAADEVVRSCWDPPFERSRTARPTAPLCYLDESFDALATPRRSPPVDIPAGDALIGSFVRNLPVPTISLPITCLDQPWWLALIPHEVGHHLQFDLEGTLEQATSDALGEAARAVASDLEQSWRRWSLEAFADAWAVLMIGGTLGWIIAQLLVAEPSSLVILANGRSLYPPTLVRLALLGELGRLLAVDLPGPSSEDVAGLLETADYAGLDPEALAEHRLHLRAVPSVASALLKVRACGDTIQKQSGWRQDLLQSKGTAWVWSQELLASPPSFKGSKKQWSARTLTAALGVAAMRAPTERAVRDERFARLRERGLALLPTFGPEGDLAAPLAQEPVPDTARIAATFTKALFAEVI
jgi:hypothetical protein